MSLSPKRTTFGTLLLATALSANLMAQIASTQVSPAVQEPADSSFDDALNHGIIAFRDARYAAAVQHFKTALVLDTHSATARLYLGTAYAYQVIPNLDTPENLATANNAIETLKQIPEGPPISSPPSSKSELSIAIQSVSTSQRKSNCKS